jgi:hypothetical protein
MQLTLLLTPLLAAFALAAPAEIDARQARTLRVQLSNDATDTAVQRNIAANGYVTSPHTPLSLSPSSEHDS